MITTCTGCHVRYRLDAQKVPHRKIRVRCPDCGGVFDLDGSVRDAPAPAPATAAPVAGRDSASAAVERLSAPANGSLDLDLDAAAPEPAPEPAPAPKAAPAAAERPAAKTAKPSPAAGGVAVADAPKQGRRRRRDKTEMLARALVSDILVYNREARDKALADGNLLEALGPEIKKSWELYKEKVGAEAATGTSYFKDALNEILAEGQDIF